MEKGWCVMETGTLLSVIGYEDIALWPVVVKLLISAVCGAMLGLGRTMKGRAAGLRTYSMVCIGATVVMMAGIAVFERTGQGDPTRMGAQVVSGIGFLGAGAIIVTGYHEIKGLTTAAGLWVSACIGLAVGGGYYLPALFACFIVMVIMVFGQPIQHFIENRSNRMRLLVFFDNPESLSEFFRFGMEKHIALHDVETITSAANARTGMVFSVSCPPGMNHDETVTYLMQAPGVYFIERM